ncbi:hypothetical protein KFE98_19510 [bacterium SCSIO 12741]|nr:hypothetical protein KFE98_19510 [bacterium SCSIO 12741]
MKIEEIYQTINSHRHNVRLIIHHFERYRKRILAEALTPEQIETLRYVGEAYFLQNNLAKVFLLFDDFKLLVVGNRCAQNHHFIHLTKLYGKSLLIRKQRKRINQYLDFCESIKYQDNLVIELKELKRFRTRRISLISMVEAALILLTVILFQSVSKSVFLIFLGLSFIVHVVNLYLSLKK